MARRTNPSEDDWRNVEDAKKRKKIQDRLAQRARRQRLREAKNNSKRGDPRKDETHQEQDAQQQDKEAQQQTENNQLTAIGSCNQAMPNANVFSYDLLDMVPMTADSNSASDGSIDGSEPFFEKYNCESSFDIGHIPFCQNLLNLLTPPNASSLSPSPTSQPNFPLTVYGALYINGQIMGISCSTVVPAKSTPATPDIPLPLHPTSIQLTTIHPRWIDRFPFPKMRNSLISLSGVIDEEEFMRDLALIPSFSITPGRVPWDPRAWKIEKPFADKWGYLFF